MIVKLNKSIKTILAVLSVFVLVVIFAFLFISTSTSQKEFNISELTDNWNVEINGEIYRDVALDGLAFEPPHEGDVITLTTVLPNINVINPTIRFLEYHMVADAYLDGEIIYSYGHEPYDKGKMLGSLYHDVKLPDDFTGKTFRLDLTVTEENTISKINPINLGSGRDHVLFALEKDKMTVLISAFLMISGIILMLMTAALFYRKKMFANLFLIALSAFLLGVWIICNYRLANLFSLNYEFNTMLEYVVMYMIPIPLLLYFRSLPGEANCRLDGIFFRILIAVSIAFFMAACLLHWMDILHFPRILRVSHMIMGADILFVIYISIKRMRRNELANRVILIGFGVFATFVGIDLIRFELQTSVNVDSLTGVDSFVPVGAVILFVCIITSYCIYMLENVYTITEQKILKEMAYSDYLTKLFNRAKCEEVMRNLSKEKTPYTLILFDLNNLKKVNDTLGHARGDEYLKDFSGILDSCFSHAGTVGRMGGDEFLFIGPKAEEDSVAGMTAQFDETMRKKNNALMDMAFSAAYGCAYSGEIDESNSEKIFALADKRMYEMKAKMKKEDGEHE